MRAFVFLAGVLVSAVVFACKPARPESFKPGSADAPPAVRVVSSKLTLGPRFGGPGPGDCSELGTLTLTLEAVDGSMLDGRFGAKVVVMGGELPVVTTDDLSAWVGRIENNTLTLRLADDRPLVDATFVVQAVNSQGVHGTPSDPVREQARAGCQVVSGAPLALGLLAALAWRRRRAR